MVIKADKIEKSFGSGPVLKGVSMQIDQGSVYGLVGLNGSGKTTLIRLILGLLKKSEGTISVLGSDPWAHDPKFYRRLGVVLESDGFFGNMTVRENLRVFASAKGISPTDTNKYLKEYWAGTEIYTTQKRVKYLSRGQRVQCGLCRAFMGWPELSVFDEPAVSLDISAYEHLKSMIVEAKSRSSTVLISSHQLETIDDLCDRVGLLRDGAVGELSASHLKKRWVLAADGDCQIGEIIESEGGSEVCFTDGYWRFGLKGEKDLVPGIVRKLVHAGCNVRELRPEKREFSDSIRHIYGSKESAEQV